MTDYTDDQLHVLAERLAMEVMGYRKFMNCWIIPHGDGGMPTFVMSENNWEPWDRIHQAVELRDRLNMTKQYQSGLEYPTCCHWARAIFDAVVEVLALEVGDEILQ